MLSLRPPEPSGDCLAADYWNYVQSAVQDPADKAECVRIASELNAALCVTMDDVFELTHGEIREIVCPTDGADGTKRMGWVAAMERKFKRLFGRLASNAPPSAIHVMDQVQRSENGEMLSNWNRDMEKLGDHLTRNNLMHLIKLPFESYAENINFESDNPAVSVTYNDQKAIADQYFLYMAGEWGYVKGDKLIEEHAGKMTKRHFSTTYTGLPWNKVYNGRMRNGKKTKAKECVPPFLPPSLPPSIQLTDHACDALSPSIPA